MCLLSVAWQPDTAYPFVFAGNRDEYHARPSAAANWWDDAPDVVGGRDLLAGGSWLGMHRDGRFAVVTNRPDLPAPEQGALSRGDLVSAWLREPKPVGELITDERLEKDSGRYGGFSLLLGDLQRNESGSLLQLSGGNGLDGLAIQTLPPGITGLSNTAPESPWPKLQWLNNELAKLMTAGQPAADELFAMLQRQTPVPDAPAGGVPATPFVHGSLYGTRCCTVILVDHAGRCQFIERRFGPNGSTAGESTFEFNLLR
jgi:uncharacterized protein with NRDE domain